MTPGGAESGGAGLCGDTSASRQMPQQVWVRPQVTVGSRVLPRVPVMAQKNQIKGLYFYG